MRSMLPVDNSALCRPQEHSMIRTGAIAVENNPTKIRSVA